MNDTSWFLGIDLGTGSCKAVIVGEQARVLGFGASDYSGQGVQGNWQEQDPQALLTALIQSVRVALDNARVSSGGCAGISIGGALHSLLALDRFDQPLTGVMTWADGRAALQAAALKKTPLAARLYQQTGCPVHWMYPLYKIIWLREHRPELARQAHRFVSAKEYLVAQLTGVYAADYSIAAGSGLLNTHSLQWDELVLQIAGIQPQQLSTLHAPMEVFPGIKPEIARQLGISPATPLVLGCSDAVNSSLGAGGVHPWEATCMIGTSGSFRVISPRPVLDEGARNWCYAIDENHWLVGGAVNNGGIALAWLRDVLNGAFPTLPSQSPLSFEAILTLAQQAGPGAGGLLCLPLFAGERSPNWNLNARGLFFGLTLDHDARHLARAVLEGIAFRFRSLKDMLAEMGLDIRQVRASGGFTKSKFWLQLMADVLGRELTVPREGETSALGAAFLAMRPVDLGSALEKAGEWVQLSESYQPNPPDAVLYSQLYPLFQELYQAASPLFDRMAQFQQHIPAEKPKIF